MSTEAFPLRWPPGWPRTRSDKRRGWSSRLSPGRAYQSLCEELERIDAEHVVINSNVETGINGAPRAGDLDRYRDDPGVAIYFQYHGKPMVMAQDAYIATAANMRSLALAIEAMRAIERHGGGYMMQRSFEGFAQLPPPSGGATYTARPWRDVLGMTVFESLEKSAQLAIAEAYYKRDARKAHPDQPGGSAQAMAELNNAIEGAREELR